MNMGRRSKAFQRRRRKNTNAIGTKASVGWWNPMGIKANANAAEISRLIREDLNVSAANDLRKHSDLIQGETHEET